MSDGPHRGRRDVGFGHGPRSVLDDLIFRFRARRILAAVPSSAAVVADLGSGHDYRLLRYLCDVGKITRGVAVDITLEHGNPTPCVQLIEGDLGKPLQIPSESADVVLSVAVLEHLDDPQLHLREAHRVLRPLGRLLLTSPSPRSQPLLEFLAFRLHIIDEHEIRDHRRYYGEADIRRLLADAGFDSTSIRYRRFLFGLNQFCSVMKAAQDAPKG